MQAYEQGDRVRIDIPDESDPDHGWHGKHGEVVEVVEDEAGSATGDERDSYTYRVELEEQGVTVDVRWRDLRPV